MIRHLLFSVVLLSCGLTAKAQEKEKEKVTCMQVVSEMLSTINNMQTITYNLEIAERFNDKMVKAGSSVKLNTHPRKIYIKIPKTGAELLWIQGQNNGNAFVNPNQFPFINLNLDPMGSILRSDQHHTIHELGFTYFARIIGSLLVTAKNDVDRYFRYEGEQVWNGRECYKIVIENPDFKFVPYTVKKGETPISIARKLNVGEYMILERNKLKDYGTIKEGKVIQVPTSYAKKTVILVDKQLKLPLNQKISDDIGLYESYEYSNIRLNVPIADEEFTRNYKGYKF